MGSRGFLVAMFVVLNMFLSFDLYLVIALFGTGSGLLILLTIVGGILLNQLLYKILNPILEIEIIKREPEFGIKGL